MPTSSRRMPGRLLPTRSLTCEMPDDTQPAAVSLALDDALPEGRFSNRGLPKPWYRDDPDVAGL